MRSAGTHPAVFRHEHAQLVLEVVAGDGGVELIGAERRRHGPLRQPAVTHRADRVLRHQLPLRLVVELEATQLHRVRRLQGFSFVSLIL